MITIRATHAPDGFVFSLDIGQRTEMEMEEDVPAKVAILWSHMNPPDHVHEWMGPWQWLAVARILTGRPWQEFDFRVVLMPGEEEILRFEGEKISITPTAEPEPVATARIVSGESQIVLLNKATGQEVPIQDLVEASGNLADAFTGFSSAFADSIGAVTPEDEENGQVIRLFGDAPDKDEE